jgi:hypothetical protein
MTVRCPECSATLRIKQERIGNRTHGTCPSCHASVPLKPAEERIQVRCTQCSTMLKAPASSAGMQGRCPKCRAAITIARPGFPEPRVEFKVEPPVASHAKAHGHEEESRAHDAESSVSTQRISVRALGIETMAFGASAGETPTTGGKGTSRATTTGKGTATSLLESPPAGLTHAAEGIKAAAKGIPPTATPGHTTAKKGDAAPTHGRTLAEILEQRERANDEQFASTPSIKAFSTMQGIFSGATAGAIVGVAWAILRTRFDAEFIETFIAPPPAFASRLGIPGGLLGIALAVIIGALIGLGTAFTEPARAATRPGLRFVRSVCFGLCAGLVMAAAWFFTSGNPGSVAGLTPAFNWVRDAMLCGILTGALLHLFSRSRS